MLHLSHSITFYMWSITVQYLFFLLFCFIPLLNVLLLTYHRNLYHTLSVLPPGKTFPQSHDVSALVFIICDFGGLLSLLSLCIFCTFLKLTVTIWWMRPVVSIHHFRQFHLVYFAVRNIRITRNCISCLFKILFHLLSWIVMKRHAWIHNLQQLHITWQFARSWLFLFVK